jgi:hypothetical protein
MMSNCEGNNKYATRIGYLILAHRYPEQLLRLVNRLDGKNVVFLVHIDKKVADPVNTYLQSQFFTKKNVRFIKRFTCHWAGFGIIQATLQGIKEAVENKIEVDHLVLLSGQDYPIKSNDYINEFLFRHKGFSFVNHKPFPQPEWKSENGGWHRVESWHFIRRHTRYVYPCRNIFGIGRMSVFNPVWNIAQSIMPKFRRTFPLRLHPFGGAQFWCLSNKHFHYIYDFIQRHPQYLSFFKYVFVPDEILIQTIIGNANFQQEIYNDTLHFLEWNRPGAVLNTSDKENIFSTYHLFARKFDTTVDANILNVIDSELLYKDKRKEQADD